MATSTRSVNIDVQSRLLYTLAMRGEEAWGACWRSGTAAATPEWRGGQPLSRGTATAGYWGRRDGTP